MKITEKEKTLLLKIARRAITEKKYGNKNDSTGETKSSSLLEEKTASFVTLTLNEELRGCIGRIVPELPLLEDIAKNAYLAAYEDPRFPPVTKNELGKIRIQISVLEKPERLNYAGAEKLTELLAQNKPGVIIESSGKMATFLPDVWEELPDPEDFLSHLCAKAGLPANEWRKNKLKISTYKTISFSE